MYLNNHQRIIQSPATAGATPQLEPQVFNFTEQQVRVLGTPDAPWFVAVDVCKILDVKNAPQSLLALDPDEKSQGEVIDSLGRKQKASTVNESGLYALIFRSNKPQAKTFRKWVTNEVLPAIRQQGRYALPVQSEPPTADECCLEALVRKPYFPDPNLVAREMIDNHILSIIIEIARIVEPNIETREVKHLYTTCRLAAHSHFRKHPAFPKNLNAFTRIMNRLQPDFMRHNIGYYRQGDEISIWKRTPSEIAALADALFLFKPLPSKRESALHLALAQEQALKGKNGES